MDNFKLVVNKEIYKVSGNDIYCYLYIDFKSGKDTLAAFNVVGRAHCNSDDTFVESKGKKIAQTKATQKAYDKVDRWFKKQFKTYKDIQNGYDQFIDKYAYVTERNVKYLKNC